MEDGSIRFFYPDLDVPFWFSRFIGGKGRDFHSDQLMETRYILTDSELEFKMTYFLCDVG